MLLSPLELLMPAVMLILIFLPLIKVIRGKTSLRSAKIRLASHICMFFGIAIGFVAAALATGLSSLGAGIAVAFAAPAAIGAFSENKENFGKAMIFVAMGEGVTIYGLLISIIMIFMKL